MELTANFSTMDTTKRLILLPLLLLSVMKNYNIKTPIRFRILFTCTAFVLTACTTPSGPSQSGEGAYTLTTASDGKLYRLNKTTGETSMVSGEKTQRVGQSNAILLEIGRKYFVERNRSVTYLGDGKFTPPIEDYSALWN